GLRALLLFVRAVAAAAERPAADPFVDEIVAILRVCQHADDELALLKEVCVRVRKQLRAAAVAFVASRDGHLETLVNEGPRMDTDVARRAIEASQTIAPHRVQERLDAASAVVYGGA